MVAVVLCNVKDISRHGLFAIGMFFLDLIFRVGNSLASYERGGTGGGGTGGGGEGGGGQGGGGGADSQVVEGQ